MARILVIDDDLRIREIFRDALADAGHEVVMASNGRDGVQLYHREPVDLVILDLFMPYQEGIASIRELRDANPRLPIIAVSGGGQAGRAIGFLELARRLGAQRAFEKPVDLATLVQTVAELLPPTRLS